MPINISGERVSFFSEVLLTFFCDRKFFFFKIFKDINPFLVMSALGFKTRVDFLLACFLTIVILRFTSGVTPADCIEVSSDRRF